jgi:hypothetical protein
MRGYLTHLHRRFGTYEEVGRRALVPDGNTRLAVPEREGEIHRTLLFGVRELDGRETAVN